VTLILQRFEFDNYIYCCQKDNKRNRWATEFIENLKLTARGEEVKWEGLEYLQIKIINAKYGLHNCNLQNSNLHFGKLLDNYYICKKGLWKHHLFLGR
jgi:hypothetical protein